MEDNLPPGVWIDDPADEDADEYHCCPECGTGLEAEDCWYCFGEGEFSLYEIDAINFGPDEYKWCSVCQGDGTLTYCPNARHHKASEQGAD